MARDGAAFCIPKKRTGFLNDDSKDFDIFCRAMCAVTHGLASFLERALRPKRERGPRTMHAVKSAMLALKNPRTLSSTEPDDTPVSAEPTF